MNITPFRFGPPEKSLYGVFHAAETRRQPVEAVLLCNPFGQEAVRIHRLYRLLAERLARKGIHVLRFDYFGTGESAGEDNDATLQTWIADIHLAHQELKNRSRAASITWLGARLGGALCAMASASAASPPQSLVLWESVANGTDYLRELAQAHVDAVAYSIWGTAIALADVKDEAIGFGVSAELLRELKAVNASQFASHKAERVTLITNSGAPGGDEVLRALQQNGRPVEHVKLDIAFDWTSEEAMNTALVPANALQLISNMLEKGPA